MFDIASKEDSAVRYSIWEIYKNKCYYCKHPIKFIDMEIDHIIPDKYRRESEELTLALLSIGKEKGFEINSLQNFVPACRKCNREKGDQFVESQILMALAKAEKEAPKIKKKIAKFKKDIEIGKKAAFTKSDIETGSKSPQDIYDFLADDQEGFEDMEHSNYENIGSSNWYVYSKKNVRLDAFLPQDYKRMTVSCAFSFRTIRIRGCTIALGHKEILDTLFPGLNTDLKLGFREFIISPEYKPNEYYIIRLAGNQFLVTSEEANNLCQIIDDFMKAYIESIQKIEKLLGTEEFELLEGSKSSFRLLKISGWLWRNIIKFANKFDYEDGDSPWNMFSHNEGMLIVCTGENMKEKFDPHVHATLQSEWVNGYSSLYPNDEVWIVWAPGAFLDRDLKNLNMREYWSPEFTFNWLTEQLIPYVIYHFEQEGKLWFAKTSFQDFMKDFDITAYTSHKPNFSNPNYNDFRNINRLTSLIESMRNFYNAEQTYFDGKDLRSLCTALRLCFIKIKIETEDYYRRISHILNFIKGSALKDILKDIENYKMKLTDEYVRSDEYISSNTTGDALTCILFLLNNRKNNLNEHEIQLILDYIKPFTNFYQTKKLIEKYRGCNSSLR